MNTHYGVVVFGGDPAGEHEDPDLHGREPSMELIACGDEAFCWRALAAWTAMRPLRHREEAEVLGRDLATVTAQARAHADRHRNEGAR